MNRLHEVADRFAAGGTKGKVRAFRINGPSLYHWAMLLAYRQANGTFLLNADTATKTTSARQSELRSAVRNKPQALLPFSALNAANIHNYDNIVIIDRTEDTTRERTKYRINKKTGERESYEVREHFLGETLFKAKINARTRFNPRTETWTHPSPRTAYFVCGLDRNDDPTKRNFFLTELPKGTAPKTVEEALELLRPASVGEEAMRQGEWFFQPVNGTPRKNFLTLENKDIAALVERTGVKINPKRMKVEKYDHSPFSIDGRLNRWEKRHWVQKALVVEAGKKKVIFVSGMVKDRDHRTVSLKDKWHLVVRNTAVQSFRAGGGVD